MILDEAIIHAEEVSEENERLCEQIHPALQWKDYGKCASEHRQLAEQKTVEGYIEVIDLLPNKGIVCICNEDGKNLGLEKNFRIPGDMVVGTVIICGVDGGEFTDLPATWGLAEWKFLLSKYEECKY